MHEKAEELAHTMTLEMGKRISEARGEVEFSSTILAYYAKNAERFLANVELHPTLGDGHMESSPIGVIFGVEPWNFPYYQLARVAGPHLMAGNVAPGQACRLRTAMCDRLREAMDRSGRASRPIYQSSDFARPVR